MHSEVSVAPRSWPTSNANEPEEEFDWGDISPPADQSPGPAEVPRQVDGPDLRAESHGDYAAGRGPSPVPDPLEGAEVAEESEDEALECEVTVDEAGLGLGVAPSLCGNHLMVTRVVAGGSVDRFNHGQREQDMLLPGSKILRVNGFNDPGAMRDALLHHPAVLFRFQPDEYSIKVGQVLASKDENGIWHRVRVVGVDAADARAAVAYENGDTEWVDALQLKTVDSEHLSKSGAAPWKSVRGKSPGAMSQDPALLTARTTSSGQQVLWSHRDGIRVRPRARLTDVPKRHLMKPVAEDGAAAEFAPKTGTIADLKHLSIEYGRYEVPDQDLESWPPWVARDGDVKMLDRDGYFIVSVFGYAVTNSRRFNPRAWMQFEVSDSWHVAKEQGVKVRAALREAVYVEVINDFRDEVDRKGCYMERSKPARALQIRLDNDCYPVLHFDDLYQEGAGTIIAADQIVEIRSGGATQSMVTFVVDLHQARMITLAVQVDGELVMVTLAVTLETLEDELPGATLQATRQRLLEQLAGFVEESGCWTAKAIPGNIPPPAHSVEALPPTILPAFTETGLKVQALRGPWLVDATLRVGIAGVSVVLDKAGGRWDVRFSDIIWVLLSKAGPMLRPDHAEVPADRCLTFRLRNSQYLNIVLPVMDAVPRPSGNPDVPPEMVSAHEVLIQMIRRNAFTGGLPGGPHVYTCTLSRQPNDSWGLQGVEQGGNVIITAVRGVAAMSGSSRRGPLSPRCHVDVAPRVGDLLVQVADFDMPDAMLGLLESSIPQELVVVCCSRN